jgi:hypothetical protein
MNLHFEAVEWPFPGFERWQLPEKGFQGGGFRLSGASREDMDSLRHPSFLAYILAYLLKWKITHFENVENFRAVIRLFWGAHSSREIGWPGVGPISSDCHLAGRSGIIWQSPGLVIRHHIGVTWQASDAMKLEKCVIRLSPSNSDWNYFGYLKQCVESV